MLPTSVVVSHLYLSSTDSDHRCWLLRPPTRLRLAQPATPEHRVRDSTLQFRSVPTPRDHGRTCMKPETDLVFKETLVALSCCVSRVRTSRESPA
ncbi:hypothetical protein ACMD2_17725 [Ananas comosus]|uniref:Uncharacterized protein n=1 Tax=Ananas comosus TaxID=4615 RepID=A0A199VYY8_ANACO|nr:hypothetical protein ACMD2_17725 [Ananas comosus]